MSGVWIFGYGSLVSPASFAYTLGRELTPGTDFHPAELQGYGRRWNYGVMSSAGESVEPDGRRRRWTIVALGLVESAEETVNGIVARVTDDELRHVDGRERNYDRVDVSALISVPAVAVDEPIVTYVPRAEPLERYAAARDRGTAAVERRYWDLVDGAFADLGRRHRDRYHASTPRPDVPIVAMQRDSVPERHRLDDRRGVT